ncbi:MAG: LemA family protein [Gemmatimonadota bacterium]|jgi:LemA protein
MSWIIILVVLAVGGIVLYNSLVKLRVQVDGAWADIDVQLKRRHDLIPNIVETVKGYAGHEKDTLEAVVTARSAAIGAQGPAAQAEAENMLTGALKSLFALSEAYPDLKAADNFKDLQQTLKELETGIQQARRYYNAVVRDYNTKIGQVPSNLIAKAFNFSGREFFEIDEGEGEVPSVSFS